MMEERRASIRRRFALVGLALLAAHAAGAQDPGCQGRRQPVDRVYDFAITVAGAGAPSNGDELHLLFNWRGREVVREVAEGNAQQQKWLGHYGRSFEFGEIDLGPAMRGSWFTGPIDCSYVRIGQTCVAHYEFRLVSQVLGLTLQPASAVKIRLRTSGDGAQRTFHPDCVPSKEDWRLGNSSAADRALAQRVRDNLASDAELAGYAFTVLARGGTVELVGRIGPQVDRERARQVALRTPGVGAVVDDDLQPLGGLTASALLELGATQVTIEGVRGHEVLFSVPVDVDWEAREKLEKGEPWPLTREKLEESYEAYFKRLVENSGSRTRIAGMVEGTLNLGSVERIVIVRVEW